MLRRLSPDQPAAFAFTHSNEASSEAREHGFVTLKCPSSFAFSTV
jgi:hypothetical protein